MSKYYSPSAKEVVTLQRSMNFICKICQFYLDELAGKELFLCTKNQEIKARFDKNSIFHLLGVKHKQGNYQFWIDVSNERLYAKNLYIQKFTIRKFQVMREFPSLFFGDSYLTDGFELINVNFDKAMRTEKLILAVGLGEDGDTFFPQSAVDIRGNSEYKGKGDKIEEIYYIDKETNERIYLKQSSL